MPRAVRPFLAFALAVLAAGCATTQRPADPLASARADLRVAERQHSVALYLDAARQALPLATSDATPAVTRAEALALYNRAVAHAVIALSSHESAPSGYSVAFTPPRGIDRFLVAEDISRRHLKTNAVRPGFGGALVGVIDNPAVRDPNRPPKGYALPFTAVAEFGAPRDGRTPVTIRILDPRAVDFVRLADARRPLAGDFTAPLAYFPHVNELVFGALAMLRSDLSVQRSALMFYEPYDPKKIPVLFVHGLMSSPHAWLQVANQLQANPEFRRRYQLWAYFYPTGAPIAGNALRLREALSAAVQRYRLRPNLVLIGHSMGGILSRMQVTNTGRTLWNGILRDKADSVAKQVPPDSVIVRALVFRANPYVKRVIFIATPHRGSYLATLRISNVAAALIRMPTALVKQFDYHTMGIVRQIDPSMRSIPTSIQGLSPRSRLTTTLAAIPPAVPYDSIVGNRGRDREPVWKSSDGIVPYWSSHMAGAQTELIVPTGHDAFNNPAAVADIERILGVSGATVTGS